MIEPVSNALEAIIYEIIKGLVFGCFAGLAFKQMLLTHGKKEDDDGWWKRGPCED